MRDGCYLLVNPGADFGVPVTLKNSQNDDGTPFTLIVGIEGVRLLSNLPPGYRLIPLLPMPPERVAALEEVRDLALWAHDESTAHSGQKNPALVALLHMIAESQEMQA